MTRVVALCKNESKPIELAEKIGGGAEANIFQVRHWQGCVAKIYKEDTWERHATRNKLTAMIASPPRASCTAGDGRTLPWFAWPTHIVEDAASGSHIGFLMAELAKDKVTSLQAYMSRGRMRAELSAPDCMLRRRVEIAGNLAENFAILHDHRHYVVDVTPRNVLVFKGTGCVCLIDTDSFSIAGPAGTGRFPAPVYSPGYVAPELLNGRISPMRVDDDRQDRFGLAVIVWQLLDEGVHPFQGRPKVAATTSSTADDAVSNGLYAHGLRPHPGVDAAKQSTHACWPVETRRLFDRAFTGDAAQRPGAGEWRDHMRGLLASASIVTCDRFPNDPAHQRFEGQPCPECLRAHRLAVTLVVLLLAFFMWIHLQR